MKACTAPFGPVDLVEEGHHVQATISANRDERDARVIVFVTDGKHVNPNP